MGLVTSSVYVRVLLPRSFHQLFITFADLNFLGKPEAPWETPLGVVTEGMEDVVDKLYKGYRDQQPFNTAGVNQQTLMQRGNEYLRWDSVKCKTSTCRIHRAMYDRCIEYPRVGVPGRCQICSRIFRYSNACAITSGYRDFRPRFRLQLDYSHRVLLVEQAQGDTRGYGA